MAFDYKKEGWNDPFLSVGKLDPNNKGQIEGDPWATVHTTGGGLRDRFGYGSQSIHEPVDTREEADKMLRSSIRLIERFMPNIDDKTKQRFVESDLKEKQSILQRFANDTDDALWRSDEWMYLTGGNF